MTATTPQETSRPTGRDTLRNVMVLASLWLLYSSVRSLTGDDFELAIANAERILEVQDLLGIAWESTLQQVLDARPLFWVANTYYLVHFPLTVAVLAVAFWRHRYSAFLVLRAALVITTVIGTAVHLLFPLAPPRMLDGFVDSGAVYGPNPYAIPGAEGANQIAAMPSLHVAWAILVALTLRRMGARWGGRLGLLHALMTSFVVVVTANHFVVDVLAGAAIASLAWFLATRRRRPAPTPPTEPALETASPSPRVQTAQSIRRSSVG
ncbi:MAG: phosphatase PAP2 family protein [Actinomycetota bacterium]